jgi:hypothetical protein
VRSRRPPFRAIRPFVDPCCIPRSGSRCIAGNPASARPGNEPLLIGRPDLCCSFERGGGKRRAQSRGQIARLGLQPLADVPGALVAIGRLFLREAVVHHVIAFDAERILDNPGGAIGVITVDSFVENIYWLRLAEFSSALSRSCNLRSLAT